MQIKALRKKAGLTQAQLAEEIGTIRTAIANWESGRSNPRAVELPNLAKALKCSIGELFETPEPEKAAFDCNQSENRH